MNALAAACLLGLLCCGWGLLQRWAAKVDPELDDPHCGCHGDKIRDMCDSCDERETP